MPYYTFDLVVGDEFRNQGTIILENISVATDRADQLANELSQVKPELKARGCAVRVTDIANSTGRRSIPCRDGAGQASVPRLLILVTVPISARSGCCCGR